MTTHLRAEGIGGSGKAGNLRQMQKILLENSFRIIYGEILNIAKPDTERQLIYPPTAEQLQSFSAHSCRPGANKCIRP
jgi:hypothetical protein